MIERVLIFCDNTSEMNMAKNIVHHKRTKHINVRHHFLRDNVEKSHISMEYCKTQEQILDIFTKDFGHSATLRKLIKENGSFDV